MTTPKLPLPPRRPQNKSGFSRRLACTQLTVRGHHIHRVEIVDGHPVAPRDAPESTAERQPAHTGVRDGPERRDQPLRHRLAVDLSQQAAALHRDRRPAASDRRAAKVLEIDLHAAIASSTGRNDCDRRISRRATSCAGVRSSPPSGYRPPRSAARRARDTCRRKDSIAAGLRRSRRRLAGAADLSVLPQAHELRHCAALTALPSAVTAGISAMGPERASAGTNFRVGSAAAARIAEWTNSRRFMEPQG